MAYYTAVLTRSGGQWRLRPSDIDTPEDLADLSDAVRAASRGDGGLAILEREDAWFAIVRVDGEEDPRIFVSDLPAARQGPFGVLFEDVEEWDRPLSASAGSEVADGGDDGDLGGGPVAGGTRGAGAEDETDGSDADDDDDAEDAFDDDAEVSHAGGGLFRVGSVTRAGAGEGDVPEPVEGNGGGDPTGLGDPVVGGGLVAGSDPVAGGGLVAGTDPAASGTEGAALNDDLLDVAGAPGARRSSREVGGPVPSRGRGHGQSSDDGVGLVPAPLEEILWAGDLAVLEDYGLAPQTLKLIVEDGDPSAALLAIGEQAGFADVIDEWH